LIADVSSVLSFASLARPLGQVPEKRAGLSAAIVETGLEKFRFPADKVLSRVEVPVELPSDGRTQFRALQDAAFIGERGGWC